MSYTPTNWKRGDVVTSEKLNKMETGIAGAGGGTLVIQNDTSTGTLDKTWSEIHTAMHSGILPVVVSDWGDGEYGTSIVTVSDVNDGTYGVNVTNLGSFYSDSESGYPVHMGNSLPGDGEPGTVL